MNSIAGELALEVLTEIRDGQVSNRPIYVALGVNLRGEREVLGIWADDGNEGAQQWGGSDRTPQAAETRWLEFTGTWGAKYPAVVGVWESAWERDHATWGASRPPTDWLGRRPMLVRVRW